MGLRRKARECALQMLFAADVAAIRADELLRLYWDELSDEADAPAQEFAARVVTGVLARKSELDERIQLHAEHWRIPRMAIVDRNVLRLAVFEFIYEPTPRTVVINEALEIARRFSTFEATQFINGILDAIKRQLDAEQPQELNGEHVTEDEIAGVEDADTEDTDETTDEEAEYAAHEIDADKEAVSAGAK